MIVYALDHPGYPDVTYAVVDVYPLTSAGEDPLVAHEAQVLGCDGLFDGQCLVDGRHVLLAVSVEQLYDLQADRVSDALEHDCRLLDRISVEFVVSLLHCRLSGMGQSQYIDIYLYINSSQARPAGPICGTPLAHTQVADEDYAAPAEVAQTEATVEIKPNRLVYLGYGKYWRSDQIVGLVPIEDERGPGRRTLVYVSTLSDPIVASRSQETIRSEMAAASDEEFRVGELRTAFTDLLEDFSALSPVLRRMLLNEGGIDVRRWEDRLRSLVAEEEGPSAQEDLFSPAD